MRKESIVVLGISIGTRRVGVAILKDNELLDWRVKTFKGQWGTYKLLAIKRWFEKISDFNSVNAIAMKIPGLIKSSPGLDDLIGQSKKQFEEKALKVFIFTIHDLKMHYLSQGRSNKRALLECITDKFPEVYSTYKKEKSNRNPHYINMFEAIGASHLLYEQLVQKTNPPFVKTERHK